MPEELSQDELTCLAISNEGENMLAIGRWEKPIDRLVELGLLKRFDKFNHAITPKGKQVYAASMDVVDSSYAKLAIDVVNVKEKYQAAMEEAAQKLAEAAKHKQSLTGQFPNQCAYGLAQETLKRTLEIIG